MEEDAGSSPASGVIFILFFGFYIFIILLFYILYLLSLVLFIFTFFFSKLKTNIMPNSTYYDYPPRGRDTYILAFNFGVVGSSPHLRDIKFL